MPADLTLEELTLRDIERMEALVAATRSAFWGTAEALLSKRPIDHQCLKTQARGLRAGRRLRARESQQNFVALLALAREALERRHD